MIPSFSKKVLYIIVFLTTLSNAAAHMTLLSLSASLFIENTIGATSSLINTVNYLGVTCIGLFGGVILQKFSISLVGIVAPVISAIIVFCLALFEGYSYIGLSLIFLIFILNGLNHPNNLRFFSIALDEKDRLAFFSFSEGLNAIFSLLAPILASLVITLYGVKFCYFLDGCTYLISCVPWIFLNKYNDIGNEVKIDWLSGFKTMVKNKEVFNLTISRFLTNCAYVSSTTIIPLVIAKGVYGNDALFTLRQGYSNAIISLGFIAASMVGLKTNKNNNLVKAMVIIAPLFGFSSFICFLFGSYHISLLYIGSLVIGFGTYCFRIAGITLGSAFTPTNTFGPTVIACDTMVRLWSFLVSITALFVSNWYLSKQFSIEIFLLILTLPTLSLFAPFITFSLAKKFALKNN